MNSRPPRDARCGSCGSDPGFHLSSPTEPVPALAPPFGGAAQAMGECSLCLMPYSDTIVLRCGHRFDTACLARCHAHDMDRCPICRRRHELDPGALRSRLKQHRDGYRNWRMGASKGASGQLGGPSGIFRSSPEKEAPPRAAAARPPRARYRPRRDPNEPVHVRV